MTDKYGRSYVNVDPKELAGCTYFGGPLPFYYFTPPKPEPFVRQTESMGYPVFPDTRPVFPKVRPIGSFGKTTHLESGTYSRDTHAREAMSHGGRDADARSFGRIPKESHSRGTDRRGDMSDRTRMWAETRRLRPSQVAKCMPRKYGRFGDPYAHVSLFKHVLRSKQITDFHTQYEGFGLTLEGTALTWFQPLDPEIFSNIDDVLRKFAEEFSKRGIKHNTVSHIYAFKQRENEKVKEASLRLDFWLETAELVSFRFKTGYWLVGLVTGYWLVSVTGLVSSSGSGLASLLTNPGLSLVQIQDWLVSGLVSSGFRTAATKKFIELVHTALKLEQQAKKKKHRHKASSFDSSTSESSELKKTSIITFESEEEEDKKKKKKSCWSKKIDEMSKRISEMSGLRGVIGKAERWCTKYKSKNHTTEDCSQCNYCKDYGHVWNNCMIRMHHLKEGKDLSMIAYASMEALPVGTEQQHNTANTSGYNGDTIGYNGHGRGRGRGSSGDFKWNFNCYKCEKYGHFKARCPKPDKPIALEAKQPERVPVRAITRSSGVIIEKLPDEAPV
ncbi:hypothetical protein L7F22_061187 [Adiantum nelumboides]|nr:hypothetical protein [Adiantum nelumboides]